MASDSKSTLPKIHLVNLHPDQVTDNQANMIKSFLTVYEKLNALSLEKNRLHSEDTPVELLKQIELTLRERDELEDQFAPKGVLVEPCYQDGIAMELTITLGSLRAGTFAAQVWISSSAAIPLE